MDFREATDRLAGCVSHQEIADELGVSLQAIRQARLDPSHRNHRAPPKGWEQGVARLAHRKGVELLALARGAAGGEEDAGEG